MALAGAELRSGEVARDAHIVGTISLAHFFSHFYQYSLPLLFPLIHDEYGVTFAQLGLLGTIFYGTSGLAQTAAGFLVDRIGPQRILAGGLGLLAASIALVALVPEFWMMFPAAAFAGLGNSVFHPADYSIMSHRVAPSRIGKAFAVHAVSGTLGYAAAPIAMVSLAQLTSWHTALLIGALAGGLAFLVVLARQGLLRGDAGSRIAARPAAEARGSAIAALRQPAVLMCFSFFFLMAVPSVGMSGFLATTLQRLFATPLTTTAAALTAYLIGGAVGVLVGGVLADRMRRHERIVMTSVSCSAALFLLVGFGGFAPLALGIALACAGFSSGLATPSRDMLVRSAAAASATGKVFGFAYSGFDLGSALAPPCLGLLIDRGLTQWLMPAIAASLLLVILSALKLTARGAD